MSKKYITTFEQLRNVGTELGELKAGTTYAQFMQKAREIAVQRGITEPALMLAMKYRQDTHTNVQVFTGDECRNIRLQFTEVVYPISEMEWEQFITDIPTYMIDNPSVWMVDGSTYTAYI